ncbi:MAG: gliding motility-associated C-terminal domain-containing protein, partial [Bacteroidales bacterium]|nr:gliding motility-associated C-terminal domain-containing protein [Bacteroidales bacterium]
MTHFYQFISRLRLWLTLMVFLATPAVNYSQILINSGVSPDDMVENIVGEGIVYSNVTFQGADISRGIFSNGGTTNIGLESGIFLTSGAGYLIPGPNSSSSSGVNNGFPGDPQLTALSNQSTYDAAVLEFDFIPESDTLRFRYVFGSEEYPEWVLNLYNDVFGYFVTGPDPEGGQYINKNIALVPGTQLPVAIATINNVIPSYPQYYVDNTGGLTIEYDGFTTVLTAWVLVVPCETYHIKMAVADSGDGIYDTGVFIEENSFVSPRIEVQAELIPAGVGNFMVEGCVEANIIFKLPASGWAPYTVHFEIQGTAINGVDYEEIPDSVFIPSGTDTASIHVEPLYDGITEGDETIIFIIENTLGCTTRYDTVEVIILDYVDMETTTSGNTMICEGQEVTIWAAAANGIPPYGFEWLNTPFIDDTITVSPTSTTTYVVQITDMCENTVQDSVQIVVNPAPTFFLGNDTTICHGDTLVLDPGPGYMGYEWQNGSTSPVFYVVMPGLYWCQITSTAGCTSRDSINVNMYPPINLDIGNGSDTINICEGDTAVLNAGSGFVSYLWQDMTTTDSIYFAILQGWYWVNVTDWNGCDATDSVFLAVDPLPVVNLGNDTTICTGESYILNAGAGFQSYVWNGTPGGQYYSVSQAGTYWVKVTNACGTGYDTITVNLFPEPVVNLGNDTTICFGESVLLDAGFGFVSYAWNTGWDQQYLDVTQSGLYSVTVTDFNNCHAGDEIQVDVSHPQVDLGPDTLFCEGESFILDAGPGFEQYWWQGVPGGQTFTVTQEGLFNVLVVDEFGCEGTDDIALNQLPIPSALLGGDQNLCEGDTLLLYAPEGEFTYLWNGMPGSSQFVVTQSGYYELNVSNACGSATDGLQVDIYPYPEPYLGPDNIIYPGESFQLDGGEDYAEYTWQDGSQGRYFTITGESYTEDGYYWVEVSNGYCKGSDTILIEEFRIEIPNVFTPNGDGLNDIFQPRELSGLKDFTLVILNRWGTKVHEMDSFLNAWDGTSNGRECAAGVYFWVFECTFGPENL